MSEGYKFWESGASDKLLGLTQSNTDGTVTQQLVFPIEVLAKAGVDKICGSSPDQSNPKDLIGVTKLSLTKVPDVALAHCAAAMMDGAIKYGPYNWRTKAVRAEIYVDACRRHLAQWFDREEVAGDSGVHHLGHAMACLAILLDAQSCGAMIDDRPEMAGGFCLTLDSINKQIKEGKSK